MSLPALLSELRLLAPRRVRWVTSNTAQVFYAPFARMVIFSEPDTFVWIEAALRDECEGRGWDWMVQRQDRRHEAMVFLPPVETGNGRPITPEFIGKASTPAEALAAAVIQALKSETLISDSAPQPK